MRLVLILLARANVAWATASMVRCDRLRRESDAAMDDAERQMRQAGRLAERVRSGR